MGRIIWINQVFKIENLQPQKIYVVKSDKVLSPVDKITPLGMVRRYVYWYAQARI